MTFKTVVDLFDLLDDGRCDGKAVVDFLRAIDPDAEIEECRMAGEPEGSFTDFIRVTIPGRNGKIAGGSARTIGLIGRLGGIGARPARQGFVSDGDGALAALGCAAKLLKMRHRLDVLEGDVIVSTQICAHAPTRPHDPVPFMSSCVDQYAKNDFEVVPDMDAILSVDTTKGNRIINKRGFAVSPTVKNGYILRVSEDLLTVMARTTGHPSAAFPITQQDITPYGNGLYHMNSILQPAFGTTAPVVGVAITAETQVPGCATGATHIEDVEEAVRFMVEVAKEYTAGTLDFYDEAEFALLQKRYGSLSHFRTAGKNVA